MEWNAYLNIYLNSKTLLSHTTIIWVLLSTWNWQTYSHMCAWRWHKVSVKSVLVSAKPSQIHLALINSSEFLATWSLLKRVEMTNVLLVQNKKYKRCAIFHALTGCKLNRIETILMQIKSWLQNWLRQMCIAVKISWDWFWCGVAVLETSPIIFQLIMHLTCNIIYVSLLCILNLVRWMVHGKYSIYIAMCMINLYRPSKCFNLEK